MLLPFRLSSAAQRLNDQLVTVTSSSAGRLSLTAVSGSTVRGSLDVAGRTLGDREVAENVTVYDQVSGGAMVFIWKFLVRPMGGVLGIYELLPAFLVALAVNVAVSLATAEPSEEVQEEFERVASMK